MKDATSSTHKENSNLPQKQHKIYEFRGPEKKHNYTMI